MTPRDYVAKFVHGPFDGREIYMYDFENWPPVWTFYRFAYGGIETDRGYLEIRYLHIRDGRYEYDETSDYYIGDKDDNIE
jgi:hypothetical protein